ncbi:MAG: LPS export ABC transporter permease LptF [Pseudomonadota bacterium]
MILQRYFAVEALKASLIILLGLFAIYLSTRFAAHLGDAAEGRIAPQHIADMVMLKMLVSMRDLIPLSLFLGCFAATVRLQRSFEWPAMRAAGFTHFQVLAASLMLTLAGAIAVGFVTLYAEPRAERALSDLRAQTQNEATIAGVRAGRFKEIGGGSRVFYAEDVSADNISLKNAFVHTQGSASSGVLRSENAHIETMLETNDRFAVFTNGVTYDGAPGGMAFTVTDFERYALRIENRDRLTRGIGVNDMLTGDLIRAEGTPFATEFQWRLAFPIVTLMCPVIAVLVGLLGRGGGWYLGLLSSVSLYFFYSNMLGVGKALMKKEVFTPIIGLWPIHLGFLLIALALLTVHRRPGGLRRQQRQQLLPAEA